MELDLNFELNSKFLEFQKKVFELELKSLQIEKKWVQTYTQRISK
jgi:hypothetical protein